MAKQTLVQLVDDFSGEPIEDGAGRTVRFAFDGAEYEIDLTNSHIEEFSNSLENYIRASRRVSGRKAATRNSGGAKKSGGANDTAAIREWAEANGIPVATRGRISAEIVEQYRNR
ncbi:histone-like nucleoid-structuring protein Lsr2 [Agrococcus terreus]|uniref:Nucleoid-associated protein Lsr2 n=1 Tax=Agrococcus terreus TaxID=574649 RepID=A0ABQ2KEB5_9MICO|nr:Lsr2 family protein [Agrococcus terreus]GGN79934.1 nucleoid-associated protein Lsr2 [Agrococcus terreus]